MLRIATIFSPSFESSREAHQRLLFAFLSAVARGDVEAISSVLAEDVVLYGDNAGKGRDATVSPILGQRTVARFFAAKARASGLDVEITDINGWPAVVGRAGGVVTFVMNIEARGLPGLHLRAVARAGRTPSRTRDTPYFIGGAKSSGSTRTSK